MINIPLSKQYRTIAGHVSIWNDTILFLLYISGKYNTQITGHK